MKFPAALTTCAFLISVTSVRAWQDDGILPAGYEDVGGYEGYSDSGSFGGGGGGGSFGGSDGLSWDLTTLWMSRYVTEGRKRVDDATFLTADAGTHFGPVNLGVWWAQALADSSYNRVDLYGGFEHKFEPGELSLGVRRVFYPSGKENHSWEGEVGFVFDLGTWFSPFARTYFDFDDLGGGFLETGVKAPISLAGRKLTLEPYGLLGVDYGYVDTSDNRPQLNNFQLGAEVRWNVNARWWIYGNIQHSFSLATLDDLDQNDVTWGGFGVRVSF